MRHFHINASNLLKKVFIIIMGVSLSVTAIAQNREHVIKRSDTLKSIAKEYNVSEKALLDANPDLSPNFLVIGATIIIPDSKSQNNLKKSAVEDNAAVTSSKKNAKQQKNEKTNTEKVSDKVVQETSQDGPDVIVMKSGDTIVCKVLSVKNDKVEYKRWDNLKGPTDKISCSEIASINHPDGRIDNYVQEIEVKDDASLSKKEIKHGKNTHVVTAGETVGSIAAAYGVSESALLYANPGLADMMYDGLILTIPEPQTSNSFSTASSASAERKYTRGGVLTLGAGWPLLPKNTRESLETNWFLNVGGGVDLGFNDGPIFVYLPLLDFTWQWQRFKGADESTHGFLYIWPVQIGVGDSMGNVRIGGLIGGCSTKVPGFDRQSSFVSGLRFSVNFLVDVSFQLLWIGESSKPTKTLSIGVRF